MQSEERGRKAYPAVEEVRAEVVAEVEVVPLTGKAVREEVEAVVEVVPLTGDMEAEDGVGAFIGTEKLGMLSRRPMTWGTTWDNSMCSRARLALARLTETGAIMSVDDNCKWAAKQDNVPATMPPKRAGRIRAQTMAQMVKIRPSLMVTSWTLTPRLMRSATPSPSVLGWRAA